MVWIEPAIRLGAALGFGSLIGLERQYLQRAAGLRTNALVSVGAALFVMISTLTPGEAAPTRVAAQVASGIGFLGAGVILREGLTVRGINTAATLWCAAAVGSLAGCGAIPAAAMGTGTVILANLLLRSVALRINDTAIGFTEIRKLYRCTFVRAAELEESIRSRLHDEVEATSLVMSELATERIDRSEVRITVMLQGSGRGQDRVVDAIVNRIGSPSLVRSATWSATDVHNETA